MLKAQPVLQSNEQGALIARLTIFPKFCRWWWWWWVKIPFRRLTSAWPLSPFPALPLSVPHILLLPCSSPSVSLLSQPCLLYSGGPPSLSLFWGVLWSWCWNQTFWLKQGSVCAQKWGLWDTYQLSKTLYKNNVKYVNILYLAHIEMMIFSTQWMKRNLLWERIPFAFPHF